MAGGSGTRFGSDRPKQFIDMKGGTMLRRATRAFAEHPAVDEIVVVVPPGYEESADGCKTAPAGADRAASVRNGLSAVSPRCEGGLVLIHDAARPFVTADVIDRVLEGAAETGAAIPVIPVTDTIYEMQPEPKGEPNPFGSGLAVRTLPREKLAAVQTPQGFDLALIRAAHTRALEKKAAVTDDGSAVLAAGGELRLVAGDPANRKVTTKDDLQNAASQRDGSCGASRLREPQEPSLWLAASEHRVGIGFDAHRFKAGQAASGPLVLGGVEIPFERGLEGHSDADVLTHALMDAILGALRLGDIGQLFPDTDARYEGISSMKLLEDVVSRMRAAGYAAENADSTLVCERPKIAPYHAEMERSLAEALGIPPERVSVKATTTEKLGFTGREEGIAAEAVVLLIQKRQGQQEHD